MSGCPHRIRESCNGILLASALILCTDGAFGQPTPAEQFLGTLSGAAAYPPNLSAGTGPVEMLLDPFVRTLSIDLSFSDLSEPVTSAHVHCCATPPTSVGVAVSFYGFPIGATSGTFQQTFDLAQVGTYTGGFITFHGGTAAGAEAALIEGLRLGTAYIDLHDNLYPTGEVRAYSDWVVFLDGFDAGNTDLWGREP